MTETKPWLLAYHFTPFSALFWRFKDSPNISFLRHTSKRKWRQNAFHFEIIHVHTHIHINRPVAINKSELKKKYIWRFSCAWEIQKCARPVQSCFTKNHGWRKITELFRSCVLFPNLILNTIKHKSKSNKLSFSNNNYNTKKWLCIYPLCKYKLGKPQ